MLIFFYRGYTYHTNITLCKCSIILLLNYLVFQIYRNLYIKIRKVVNDIEEPKHSKIEDKEKVVKVMLGLKVY